MQENITYKPIGIIHTPFKEIDNMPIQPLSINSAVGIIELMNEYIDGLKDLEGFSHIILIYHLHKSINKNLIVKPFMDNIEHGIFATRSPARVNPIGISIVKLNKIEKNLLHIEEIDVLDKTPLLDIKPFYEIFDNRFNTSCGWLENRKNTNIITSDNRFEKF